jgi:hypothetical protein
MLLLAKPSNLVSSSPCITSLLIIVYQTLYLENSVEVANPNLIKALFVLFLVMGFVDYLLCEVRKNAKPTYFCNTVCHVEIIGVMTVLQNHCLRDIQPTVCSRCLILYEKEYLCG